MKLSTRSRYGIRAMLVLAQCDCRQPLMSKNIAERQNLPITYLEQLMLALRKAELVTATRGAKGGYALAKTPEQISLADIVEALEGPLDIADCKDVPNCSFDQDSCALKCVFQDANNALREVFNGHTLAELAAEQTLLDSSGNNMYHI